MSWSHDIWEDPCGGWGREGHRDARMEAAVSRLAAIQASDCQGPRLGWLVEEREETGGV